MKTLILKFLCCLIAAYVYAVMAVVYCLLAIIIVPLAYYAIKAIICLMQWQQIAEDYPDLVEDH